MSVPAGRLPSSIEPITMPRSLRGQFLVAGCRLRDPNFFKSVVLIVEHNNDGAMGLIVNRPLSITVANALSGHFDLPDTGESIHIGGPAEPNAFFVLYGASEGEDNEGPVTGGLYLGATPEVFEEVVNRSSLDESFRYRVFSGCAGWGGGQLEGELARGDWLITPASEEVVFHDDAYEVWDMVMHQVQASHRLLPQKQAALELN